MFKKKKTMGGFSKMIINIIINNLGIFEIEFILTNYIMKYTYSSHTSFFEFNFN